MRRVAGKITNPLRSDENPLGRKETSAARIFMIRMFLINVQLKVNMDNECKNDKIWRGCIATPGPIQIMYVTQVDKYSFP